MSNHITERLQRDYPALFRELNLHPVSEEYSPEAFGNWIVVLRNEQWLLRLISDRGQVFADVAAYAELLVWWHLNDVLTWSEDSVFSDRQREMTLEGCVQRLIKNRDTITALLHPDHYPLLESALRERQQQRAAALMRQ